MAARRMRARVEVSSDRGVFMISVAAELADMHPQTLRMYEARGLIEPKRSPKGTRLYSHQDVDRLRRIQEMTAELGLNLAGVERVLELEEQLGSMTRKVAGLEKRARELKEEVRRLEQLRQELRAEIVPSASNAPRLGPYRRTGRPGLRTGAERFRVCNHPPRWSEPVLGDWQESGGFWWEAWRGCERAHRCAFWGRR
jgi:MerR family transcriptional regulator/heat shock protein HspR